MITIRCTEASFSLTVEDEAEFIEGVETFKYMVRMLDQSDNNYPEVRRSFGKACQVWSRLGKMIRREGVDLRVPAMFYWAVVQAVLIFGAETWVLLE